MGFYIITTDHNQKINIPFSHEYILIKQLGV